MTNTSADNSNEKSRTGGYAVTTVHSMPWLSTPIKQKKVKGQRQKPPPIIVNPIFNECAKVIDDAYWQSLFIQASYGKLPKGFMYKNGFLNYKIGTKKNRKIEIPENSIEAASACLSFFREMGGIRSQADRDRERLELDEKLLEMKSIDNWKWSDIKRKKIQEILINSFVETIITSMKLNQSQTKQLTTLINLGFLMGYFSANSVQFVEGDIKGITGLLYDSNSNEFIFDPSVISRGSNKNNSNRSKFITDDQLLDVDNNPYKNHMTYVSFLNLWQKLLDSIERKDLSLRTPRLRIMGSYNEESNSETYPSETTS